MYYESAHLCLTFRAPYAPKNEKRRDFLQRKQRSYELGPLKHTSHWMPHGAAAYVKAVAKASGFSQAVVLNTIITDFYLRQRLKHGGPNVTQSADYWHERSTCDYLIGQFHDTTTY